MKSYAALAERNLSERIRQTWRLRAVDDDLQAALGRRVLIAGKDLRNFGMELKHIDAGPLNLNDRQYDVLRRSRQDVPPFVFQFTAPPEHPWCFRIWALRDDALEALGQHPCVTVTEHEAEAFTMALTMGTRFTTTVVTPSRFRPTTTMNKYPGSCLSCGTRIPTGQGICLAPVDGKQWAVVHPGCNTRPLASVEITLDEGEPAYYLAQFDDRLVTETVWPDVIPPRNYAAPPLKPSHVSQAARYLDVAGVFDRAPDTLTRPELTLIRQQTSAAEIAERVLQRINDQRQADPSAVANAVAQLETRLTDHILRSPWIDDQSLRRLSHHAERLIGMSIPGPFAGSDSGSSHRANLTQWTGFDIAEWDWTAIREAEALAKSKGSRLPSCDQCGKPLWLGQHGHHQSHEGTRQQ